MTSITEYGDVSKGFVTISATATYEYDNNGNLKKDNHKGISSITYNYLNLPRKVTYAGGNWIEWTYDAAGIKLQKETSAGNKQYYLGGIEYNGTNLSAIYHEEGFLKPDGANFDYYYYLKDHLGNNRVVFHDSNGNGTITSSEITQENHYYPFGMDMQGAWTATPTDNYKYNNKELNEDFGLNWYDYGARWYMADIGRWGQIDPLAEDYYSYSPYNYVLNSPLNAIDPDGMRVVFKSEDEDGNEIDWSDVINELQEITGLSLSIGKGGVLEYKSPEGKLGGSKTARNMLIKAIKHEDDVTVMNDPYDESRVFMYGDSKEKRNTININFDQIQDFIDGTSDDLNKLTYGYGMNLLHELGHTEMFGAMEDLTLTQDPGNNVRNVNKIRREMSKATDSDFGQRVSYKTGVVRGDAGYQYERFSKHAASQLDNFAKPNYGYVRHLRWDILRARIIQSRKK